MGRTESIPSRGVGKQSKRVRSINSPKRDKNSGRIIGIKPVACERWRFISSDIGTDEADGRDKP